MEPIDIVAAGNLCLDLVPTMEHVHLKDLAIPGMLYEAGPLGVSTGGSVSNTGLALHRLGIRTRLVSIIGGDLVGHLILTVLNAHDPSLTKSIIIRPDEASSTTLVFSPEDTDRSFIHCAGADMTLTSADIDFELVRSARMFHLGYPPLLPKLIENDSEELTSIFRQVKAVGSVTSLDMVVPDPNALSGRVDWQTMLRKTLPFVDVFLPSIEEILFMLRRADYNSWTPHVLPHLNRHYLSELADELLAMGSVIVGFKLGEVGIYLRTGDAQAFERLQRLDMDMSSWVNIELWTPAYQVEVVGTTGAGDAAYAGFLAALLRAAKPDEALRWACAVGACNVEAADATSGVRTWEETGARLAAGWATRTERLAGYDFP